MSGGVSAEFAELVDALRRQPFRADLTSVDELRARFEAFACDLFDPPLVAFIPADADGVPVEWVVPSRSGPTLPDAPDAAVLYFHGGGYNIGSIATHRDLCARLADRSGAVVLSVGYRLAPEEPFPAAVHDALTAYRWLARTVPASRVVVAGDSAGGGLAAALVVAARADALEGPAGLVAFSPLLDLAHEGASIHTRADEDPLVSLPSSHTNARRYVGAGGDLKDPLASPLYADVDGFPPVFIQVGTAEILLDDSLRFARRLRDAGVPVDLDVWPSMIHILPFFAPRVPEARGAIESATSFIRRRLTAAAQPAEVHT